MFGLSKKPKLDKDHTFADGGRFTSDEKGVRRFYPVNADPNTTNTHITEESLIWTDPHPESSLLSMTIPGTYRVTLGHLFPGSATFKMIFTNTQKTKVKEFFGQLEDKIMRENESAAASKAHHIQQAKRQEVVENQISVMIDGKPAAVSCDGLSLGEVSCPVCNNPVTTPGGEFDRIRDALENTIGIEPFAAETLTHCKHCNELYKVEIDIKLGG
jgi:hypothetical protein